MGRPEGFDRAQFWFNRLVNAWKTTPHLIGKIVEIVHDEAEPEVFKDTYDLIFGAKRLPMSHNDQLTLDKEGRNTILDLMDPFMKELPPPDSPREDLPPDAPDPLDGPGPFSGTPVGGP